jgi:hypothetical protein
MRRWRLGLSVGLMAVLVSVPLAAAGGGESDAVLPCAAQVHRDVLPVWMRGGFSGPRPRVPYVLGRNGAIGGVVFGDPLNSPPAQRKNNKVLWVPRHYSKTVAALWIRMQQMEGTRPVGAPIRKIIPTGPGPSYVDAPSAGCWRLTLTWSGRRETLDLDYVAPTD